MAWSKDNEIDQFFRLCTNRATTKEREKQREKRVAQPNLWPAIFLPADRNGARCTRPTCLPLRSRRGRASRPSLPSLEVSVRFRLQLLARRTALAPHHHHHRNWPRPIIVEAPLHRHRILRHPRLRRSILPWDLFNLPFAHLRRGGRRSPRAEALLEGKPPHQQQRRESAHQPSGGRGWYTKQTASASKVCRRGRLKLRDACATLQKVPLDSITPAGDRTKHFVVF